MTSERTVAGMATPGKPRWILSAVYAALATACVCWPAWPGMMTYDSLYAYEEGRFGIQTMLWPPMHAYLFFLSAHLSAGTWGLFVGQTFLLFFSGAVALNLLVARRAWAIAGLGIFTAAFINVPELLGTAVVQWRDVTTTSFTLAGLAAWLVAARYRSRAALGAAVASLALAVSLRYNAILLVVLIAPLMIAVPFLGRPTPARTRALVAGLMVLGFGLAWASTQWRLPDLHKLPPAHNFVGVQEFDLIGVSACADRTYLPPGMTANWPITPAQIRQAYDPRHVNMAFRTFPGAPRIMDTGVHGQVAAAWPAVLMAEPGCYLAHRTAVFVEQMGLDRQTLFMPGAFAIDPNPYGLTAAHPQAMATLGHAVAVGANQLWRRPILLYLLALFAVALLWFRHSRGNLLFLALLGGAFAYPAALFFVGPAADARYIFPSNVLCALIVAAAAAILMDERRPKPTAPSPAPRS
ncbi:MAG: hypothetical protein E7812_01070 [Phenylobacterium sp.]|nr:MAG: hypothetical protein E7812_01070 [Phenylobacterium sp.]